MGAFLAWCVERYNKQAVSMPYHSKHWRYFLVLLSAFVFLLALDAKLSAYDRSGSASTVSNSKLWLNGQKMEAESPTAATSVIAIWSIAFLFLAVRFQRNTGLKVPFRVPPPVLSRAFEPLPFLRPPPIS
jgi:hypothetical protein